MKGFGDPFLTDRNIHVGGILLYAREDIPGKLLSADPKPSDCFFVELNLRKQKWLELYSSQNDHNIIIG